MSMAREQQHVLIGLAVLVLVSFVVCVCICCKRKKASLDKGDKALLNGHASSFFDDDETNGGRASTSFSEEPGVSMLLKRGNAPAGRAGQASFDILDEKESLTPPSRARSPPKRRAQSPPGRRGQAGASMTNPVHGGLA